MKKILIINNSSFFGGAERFIVTTLNKLKDRYDLFYAVMDSTLYSMLPKDKTYLFKGKSLLNEYFELKKIIGEIQPDVLLYNGSSIFYLMPLFLKYKQILYRHSTDRYAPRSRRWLYKLIMAISYYNADLTIHVSNYSLREQKIKRNRGICIHNGIEIESFLSHEVNNTFTVLFCGRLEESKGLIPIVKAFKKIPNNIARLWIVGDGSLRDFVESNICDNIQYFGFRTDVGAFYKETDALILMSSFENFPISILEAMSRSIPIITTGVGGISEMVKDSYNGLVIPLSISEIIKAIERMSSDRIGSLCMGNNAYKYCKDNFTIEKKVDEISFALNKVLNNEDWDRL